MEEIKKNGTTEISHIDGESISMDELLGKSDIKFLESGTVLPAIFVRKTPEGYLFDIGQKREAIVPKSENIPDEVLLSAIKVVVVKPNAPEYSGQSVISYRAIAKKEALIKIKEAFENKTHISGIVTKVVNGGYLIDLGIDAFLPATHATKKKEKMLARKINCMVIDLREDKVVVSEKEYVEKERERALADILGKLKPGDIVEGTVTSIAKFGAFVDIGGIDGLLHVNDISWNGVEKVEDVLKSDQKINVKVLSINPEEKKISLGLKQLTDDPWKKVREKYKVGDIVKCKVSNITSFGVFLEIESGIDGLLHISEVDWQNPNPDLRKTFTKGQKIEAKIISLDPEKNKIALSVKQLKESPWEAAAKKISNGSVLDATVSNILPFGAVLRLEDGIAGTLHIKNFDWFRSYSSPSVILKIGDVVKVYVLDFKPDKQTLELSLKHLKGNPFEKYKLKTVAEGKVVKISKAGVIVSLEEGVEAFVPKMEISRQKIESVDSVIKTGERVTGIVITSDPTKRKIELSIKKFEIAQEKKLISKYSSEKPGPSLKDILEEL